MANFTIELKQGEVFAHTYDDLYKVNDPQMVELREANKGQEIIIDYELDFIPTMNVLDNATRKFSDNDTAIVRIADNRMRITGSNSAILAIINAGIAYYGIDIFDEELGYWKVNTPD